MKKLGKKIISVLLVLCIAVSMTVMAMPSTQAFVGQAFLKKKAIDLGLRFACAAATQLAAQCENETASVIVESVIKFIISDAHGAATTEIKKMCTEILAELAIIEEDMREYSSEISSAIGKLTEENMRDAFENKWESDVDGIVEKYRLNDILNAYTKYLIVSTLYSTKDMDQETFNSIKAYWETVSNDELSYTYEDCTNYQNKFIDALEKHVSLAANPSASEVYGHAQTFADMYNAISDLISKFVYDDVSNHSEQYSVIECAATEAYYALPFSSQQYAYTVAQAKSQVMVATLLEMALNEYMSLQGEYLVENNLENSALSYTMGSLSATMTYADCKGTYQELTDKVLDETCNLFESKITINCKPYTGEPSYECTLEDYMKPEDAVSTSLTINGFEGSHSYTNEKHETPSYHLYEWYNMKDNASSTSQPINFVRVMPGGKSGEVYYILDASQYKNASYLDFTELRHDIKREYWGVDGTAGDIHIVSCDYYNLIKQMSDGVNTYKMPSKDDISTKLNNLLDVPSYGSNSNYILSDYLGSFAPANVWNGGCSSNLRILTSSYDNHLNTSAALVKTGEIHVVDANQVGKNTRELETTGQMLEVNMGSKDYSFLAILASDSGEAFRQKVSLRVDDNYDAFDESYFNVSNGTQLARVGYDPVIFEAGENLTINFTVNDPNSFDSLKMVRKNATESETILLSGPDELSEFINDDGSYSFEVTMPYSEVEFVLTSCESQSPTAVFNKIDPAGTVSYVSLSTGNDIVNFGEVINVYPGTELTLKFRIDNASTFKGFGTYNRETGEIQVIIDKDSLSSYVSGGIYKYTCTMPEQDMEFYVVTEEPEEFVPQELRTDEEGNFLIGSYEELRSAACFMNTFEEKYLTGNYKVTADINCMNAALEQMVAYDSYVAHHFKGTFDGQGHTISNINLYTPNNHGALFGVVSGGEIKNLNLAGDFTVTNSGKKTEVEIATLAYIIKDDSVVSNVNIDLTYKESGFGKCEGVYGLSNYFYGGLFENSFINAEVNMPDSEVYYAGMCIDTGSYHTTNIRNCAFMANLDIADESEIYGILSLGSYSELNIEDSYAYVELTGGKVSPITDVLSSSTYNVTNTYFLDEMLTNATSIKSNTLAESKTREQFESGEVAYLLNKSVTDGTQKWYQNLDNGNIADTYPLFDGGTVYKSAGTCISEGEGYTNVPGEITHSYNNYHVCKGCISLRPGEAAGIYGFSIGLGGNISVKYYMVLDEEVAADETAKMIFTVPDTGSTYDVEIPVSEAVKSQFIVPATGLTRVLYEFECEVAAKEMTSDIFCQIVTEERESDVFRYSVKEYADVLLANGDVYTREIPLVKSMLNYGAYAQLNFDYRTDDLANTSEYISDEDKILEAADFSSYGYTLEGEEDAISYYGSALSLKSETAVKHYFYFKNEADVENTVVTVNGEKVTPVKNGGYYEIKVADIPAHRLNENYEVKVGNITLNYSAFSYCHKAATKVTDRTLADVGNAIYAYNQAAIDYIK